MSAGGNTMTNTPTIEVTPVDDDAIAYGTFASHNQKIVANSEGIFVTHVRTSNHDYTAQQWRLSRSKDGGKTWRTVHEAVHATSAPVIETGAAGKIYLAHPDFTDGNTYLHVLAPPSYALGTPTIIPNSMAGKYSMRIDPSRGRLYYAAHNTAALYTLGLDGKLLRSEVLLSNGPNAYLQYPQVALASDGTLYFAWTSQKHGSVPAYHSVHVMRSRDGGSTWQKLDGTALTMPVIADDTGPADRISRDDDLGSTTWLAAVAPKDGKLHCVYWAQKEKRRQLRYVRYDAKTGKKDHEIVSLLDGRDKWESSESGFFAFDPKRPNSKLYFITAMEDRTRLVCLASDDHGKTWRDYAVGDQTYIKTYALGGFREVTGDGYIIGTFTDIAPFAKSYYEPHSGKVYFLRVRAK
jgi:hypothetical protein